jgi:hypothetical protein
MRPLRGGIRNIGRPLTLAGLGVLVVTLLLCMANVVAAIIVCAVGMTVIMVLARRDSENRNLLDRRQERSAFLRAARTGRGLYRSGLLGFVAEGQCRLPGVLSQVRLVSGLDGLGGEFCLVSHGHTGEYSLLIACHPQGVGLADAKVEDSYVAGWAEVMTSLASELGVTQMSVTVDTSPDSGVRFRRALRRNLDADAPALAAEALAQVMDLYATGGSRTEVTFALTYRYRDKNNRFVDEREACRRIGQQIPMLKELLAGAGAGSPSCLTVVELSRMVRVSYDPAVLDVVEDRSDGHVAVAWDDAGPSAAQTSWDWYRHDSGVSRSWQMCDPPSSNVTSSTLTRLLAASDDCDRKRVTLLFRMLPPAQTMFIAEQNRIRAAAQVGQEKTATVRSYTQITKANHQAVETTEGAVLVYFGLLVTATVRSGVDDMDRLDAASRMVEQAAGAAMVNLRVCYGAQDSAFAASLPLGLNVRSYTPQNALSALR